MQAMARGSLHPDAIVLGLLFYSDAAEARRHGHKYHPVLMYLANFSLDHLRSQRGYTRLAHISVLEKKLAS